MQVMKRLSLFSVFLGLIAAAPPAAGTFALQNAQPKTEAHLVSQSVDGNPLARSLDFWLTDRSSGATLTRYDVDMTKLLHVIVASDDFSTFLHVHPVFSNDGHFRIRQRFPKAALYHVYADGNPHGIGQQVFRFDVPVGGDSQTTPRRLARTSASVRTGPYTVELDRTSIAAHGRTMLAVHIFEGGKPASDLQPYLGALAHAVFINGRDLTYVHVHPIPLHSAAAADMSAMPGMNVTPGMDSMPGMNPKSASLPDTAASSPDMMLHVALNEAGPYKLWLQFRGGKALHVAPFVLTAT